MNQLAIIRNDPYLEPFEKQLEDRKSRILQKEKELSGSSGTISDFANGYRYYGLHLVQDGWILREWAPNASSIILIGDFTDWEKKEEYRFQKKEAGEWELRLPANAINNFDKYKLWMEWEGGADFRIPLYAKRVIQDTRTKLFDAQVWFPEEAYTWKNQSPTKDENSSRLIYEAHIGMGTPDEKVGSYSEFTEKVLPRIANLGYNTIQFMAIQEHPYYGSFGYHVSNFFAPSSRFGSPEDLKHLIDSAHGMGISVIMDIVHSHAVKNSLEGPGLYDGSPGMLFHSDHRREHVAWDSLCFNYSKDEVLHFLLSNCKYWLEEFNFDGFRFDGITSMLYLDHGLERSFTTYDDYFSGNTDEEAVLYLGLANRLIHLVKPNAISIAEDMSGLPGLGLGIEEGGLGFDYRLAMGVPDFWIKTIKEKKDEEWDVNEIYFELTNYRSDEKIISYTESHDQALVGDKTIIFRLADREMYTHMSRSTPSLIVDRAISLHKLIRMITLATNGGGYLNFMGNEFGHPEWIDFPREGNNWSYKYARRQWELADNIELKYSFLQEFDKSIIRLFNNEDGPGASQPYLIFANKDDQVIAFDRGNYLFVFNFNPVRSFTDYGIPAQALDYKIIINSDAGHFGGFERIDDKLTYEPDRIGHLGTDLQLMLYLPSRVGLVFKKIPIRGVR